MYSTVQYITVLCSGVQCAASAPPIQLSQCLTFIVSTSPAAASLDMMGSRGGGQHGQVGPGGNTGERLRNGNVYDYYFLKVITIGMVSVEYQVLELHYAKSRFKKEYVKNGSLVNTTSISLLCRTKEFQRQI